MAGFLSKLFGKENKPNTGVPPYPPSMSEADSAENKAYRKAIEASLEKFDASMNRSVEADAEMEAFYQNNVTPQSREMIFSNSYDNMARILNALSEKIPSSESSRTDHLNYVLGFYISVFSRTLVMDPFEIRDSMVNRFRDLPTDLVVDCTAESLAYISLTNEKLTERILGRFFLRDMIEKNAAKNTEIETKSLNDPQYGLKPEKPVFINGFGPHHIYLNALCTPDGVELKNDRRGSMQVRGIEGPVDVYDLFLPNGKKYMTIYLCLYGSKNSVTAPRGLCFKAENA